MNVETVSPHMGWKFTEDIEVGDILRCADGYFIMVTDITTEGNKVFFDCRGLASKERRKGEREGTYQKEYFPGYELPGRKIVCFKEAGELEPGDCTLWRGHSWAVTRVEEDFYSKNYISACFGIGLWQEFIDFQIVPVYDGADENRTYENSSDGNIGDDYPTMEQLEEWAFGDSCEAIHCGCQVESDGGCHHGNQSWLVELGMI